MARVRGGQIYSPEILEELKIAMAVESRPGQDDEVTFRQKMNALQRFLNHGMSRFSIDSWHHALTVLFQTYQLSSHHHHYQNDLTRLSGVGDLRALSRDVLMQREGGSLREADAQALKYMENFMAALQSMQEAKVCIADMRQFLYRYYYDPGAGRGGSQVHSGKALSRSSTIQPSNGDTSSYEMSAKQFGILTLQQMSGSTDHKLRRTVADMQQIMARWDCLVTEGDIRAEDLDPESQQDLQLLSGTALFEPVLRLLPDMFAKYYKCLELLKQWWVLAHEIYPELPINRPSTSSTRSSSKASPEGMDSRQSSDSKLSVLSEVFGNKVPFSEQLQKVEEDIHVKEDLLQSLSEELKLLDERERHFESLVEAYENVTANLEAKIRERKELGTVREKETLPAQNQQMDPHGPDSVLKPHRPHESVAELNELVARTDREIQLLQFQQNLLRQDYMVQLEVRPSLIRFADDLRIRIEDAKLGLSEDKEEKMKLETLLQEEKNTQLERNQASPTDVDQNHDRDDVQSHLSPELDKAAERKQELSRLLTKPLREDTSGSSIAQETEPSAPSVPEPKRRKSHPLGQREVKDRKALPAIAVQHSDDNKTVELVGNSKSQKKSPRAPTLPSSNTFVSPRSQANVSPSETHAKTDTLFHRRTRKLQETEKRTPPREDNRLETFEPRPRAKSDPHALKPSQKAAKFSSETAKRLKTLEADKQDEKQHTKLNGNGPALKPNPRDNRKDSTTQKVEPTAVRRDSQHAAQKLRGADNGRKNSDTTLTSKTSDLRNSSPKGNAKKDSDAAQKRKSIPGDVTKDTDSASHKSKSGDMKKNGDVTSPSSKSKDVKKDNVAFPQKSTPAEGRKDSQAASLKPRPTGERKKSETDKIHTESSPPKPAQGNGKNGTTASSKIKGEDKKPIRSVPPERQKQNADDATSKTKATDVRKDTGVASRTHDKAPQPNGVIAKGKKHNYANV